LASLKDFKIRIRKGKAQPKFADDALEGELQKAAEIYERNLGKRKGQFDEEEVADCFSESKAGSVGKSILGRYYTFETVTLDDFLGEKMDAIERMGVTDCVGLRLAFFQFLSTEHSGFMSSESRGQLLEDFGARMGLSGDRLDEALWLDDDDNRVLERRREVPPKLAPVYNFEMLSAMMANSHLLRLGPLERGSSVKFVFKNLKFYGLFHRVENSDRGFVFEIDGPLKIYGKISAKFGYKMAILVYRLAQLSRRREIDCPLLLEFRKSKRRISLESSIAELPELDCPSVEDLRLQLFDSKVEAKIHSTFSALDLDGWSVEREPRPYVSGEVVFIPDFSLSRGDHEVLVEVVGFWMPEYKKRKKAKLNQLAKSGLRDLILIVDEKIEDDFKSITDFPIFTYSRQGSSYRIPYSRILGYLQKHFPGPEAASDDRAPSEPSIIERGGSRYRTYW